MSELVNANPIMAQYLPKPTAGFQTFGSQQGAENVGVGLESRDALEAERQAVGSSEAALSQQMAMLEQKKSE